MTKKQPLPEIAFDLADFEDVTSVDLVVKDPVAGTPTSLVITLAGPEHPTRKKIIFDKQRKARAQLQKTGKLKFGDPVDDFDDETELLAACTIGWKGLTMGGKVVEFSEGAATSIYGDPKRRWLRDQVKAAFEERESFIARSAPT